MSNNDMMKMHIKTKILLSIKFYEIIASDIVRIQMKENIGLVKQNFLINWDNQLYIICL